MATSAPAVISVGGVFVPAEMCEPIWRVLREHSMRGRRDGGALRPGMQLVIDAFRQAASAHLAQSGMSVRGHVSGIAADMATGSIQELMTTADMAHRLCVGERQARRLAAKSGIEPVARNTWRTRDIESLVTERKSR